MNFGTVILAAGASSRMGQPKMLLPWGRGTILDHLVSQWNNLGAEQVAIVSGPPPHPVWAALEEKKLSNVARIINPVPENGMFSSIQSAARWSGWKPSPTHIVLALGDQPQISIGTLRALIDHAARHGRYICQPSLNERPKHPIILPRHVLLEIGDTSHATLRDFLANCQVPRSLLEISDETLGIDLDAPDDYKAAFASFRRGSPPIG